MKHLQPTNQAPQHAYRPYKTLNLPVKPKPFQPLPETPVPQTLTGFTTQQMPSITITPRVPSTPPPGKLPSVTIHAIYPYIPSKSRQKEIGVGETLFGCGLLLVLGILALALLYYL